MTTSDASDQPVVMTLDLFRAMLENTAAVNYGPFLQSFLAVKFGLEVDAKVDIRGDFSERGASVNLRPAFYDCKIEKSKWLETAKEIGDFVCSVRDYRGKPVFRECSVDVIETVFCDAESS
jgi:hypothetical protein